MVGDGLTTTQGNQALRLYELTLSLVQAKGLPFQYGAIPVMQYKRGNLTIHYLPKAGHLSVWHRYKVLTINPRRGRLRVTRYLPGDWEEELEGSVPLRRARAR